MIFNLFIEGNLMTIDKNNSDKFNKDKSSKDKSSKDKSSKDAPETPPLIERPAFKSASDSSLNNTSSGEPAKLTEPPEPSESAELGAQPYESAKINAQPAEIVTGQDVPGEPSSKSKAKEGETGEPVTGQDVPGEPSSKSKAKEGETGEPVTGQDVPGEPSSKPKAKEGFSHPLMPNFKVPYDIGQKHEETLQELGLPVWESFPDHLWNLCSIFDAGSRKEVAEAISASASRNLTQKNGFGGNDPMTPVVQVIALSNVICSGGLLGVLINHPSYFLGDPEKALKELTIALFSIEDTVGNYLKSKFPQEIDKALRQTFLPYSEAGKKALVNYTVAEVVVRCFQGGVTLKPEKPKKKNKEPGFKVESSLVPGICVSSEAVRSIIEPIILKNNWKFRQFARAISCFIFFYAFKNRIEGYLTFKLEKYLIPTTDQTFAMYEKTLLTEIHENSPFVTPHVKNVLNAHQKRVNRK
jgi:hypothetical protein